MKFYWYNNTDVRSYLRHKLKNPGVFEFKLGDVRYKNLYKLNRVFSDAPWGMIHDISGNVPNPLNVKSIIEYKFRPTESTFSSVALAAAKKIANSTYQRIAVTWSGGIDSTVALVALIQTVPAARLVVVCNQQSIAEFPSFYQEVIQPNIETITPSEWFARALEFFNVSGDAGDNVWGTIDQSFWEKHHHTFNNSWHNWIDQSLVDIDFVEEFCTWSGVNINTVLELRTWFYLCCKWQDKTVKFYFERPGLSAINAIPFYSVDNTFQNWTMNNLHQIIGERWTDYKVPAKQFINNFFNDNEYLVNKTKVESTSMISSIRLQYITNNTSKFALDTNYQAHTLPSWPIIDAVQFEDWNDQYHLIPQNILNNHKYQ
jgi:hypothetical protein